MANETTVASLWERFASTCVPADAGPVQRHETRMAFYGGASAMFGLMTGPLAEINEDEACAAMDLLLAEFLQHVADLTATAQQELQSSTLKH